MRKFLMNCRNPHPPWDVFNLSGNLMMNGSGVGFIGGNTIIIHFKLITQK